MKVRLYSLKFKVILSYCFFIPILFLSYLVCDRGYGDNSVYLNIFTKSFEKEIIDLYLFQVASIRAIEPVMPAIMKAFSIFKFTYAEFILITNIVFIFALCVLVSKKISKANIFPFYFIIFLSTDFYIFKLLSELHRLKYGSIFILFALLSNGFMKSLFLIVSTLSHLQFFVVVLLFVKKNVLNLLAMSLLLLFLVIYFSDNIITKLLYYNNKSVILDSIIILGLTVIFSLTAKILNFSNKRILLFVGLTMSLMAYLVGGSRISFLFFEFCVIYFYINIYQIKKISNRQILLGVLTVSVVPFNLFRIIKYMEVV